MPGPPTTEQADEIISELVAIKAAQVAQTVLMVRQVNLLKILALAFGRVESPTHTQVKSTPSFTDRQLMSDLISAANLGEPEE